MIIQEQILENKQIYHHALYGFLLSSAALNLMNKKIFYGIDPLELQKLDDKSSATLLNFQSPIFIEKILENDKHLLQFQLVMKNITDANEQLVLLAKEAMTPNEEK